MDSGRFDSGVSGYIIGRCEITVAFPIDMKGNPDISCKQCPFYHINSRSCGLTDKIVPYGEKFVAPSCPLRREEVIDNDQKGDNESIPMI